MMINFKSIKIVKNMNFLLNLKLGIDIQLIAMFKVMLSIVM